MDANLLATKFHFPLPRKTLVSRQRLIEHLIQGLQRPLTLISGSAGSGKTTLLSEWYAKTGRNVPAAWLSLDERDNDILVFLTYLSASLDGIQAGLKNKLSAILQSPQPPKFENILTIMINSLSTISTDFVLVLDDYHLITNPEIHAATSFLIENIPYQMHLVILTRIDPPLQLARLRSQGKLVELRDKELRFTIDEATFYLKQVMQFNLTDNDAAALEARTEGWAAGLQMAALSIQGREDVSGFINAFRGSHRFVMDYLTEEVLAQQSESVRNFLLKTSVLSRLNASICQAVTDREDAQSILEYLDGANIFIIPLDNERIWYRYHHLFADLLKARLHQFDPEMADRIRKKAANWCGLQGFVTEATEYALAAKDFATAADQIEIMVRSTQIFDNRALFRNLLDRLPEKVVEKRPWLCAARALTFTSFGDLEQARKFLEMGETNLAQRNIPVEEKTLFESLVAGIYAWIAEKENDFDSTLKFVKKARENLQEDHPIFLFITFLEGDVYYIRGDLEQAERARTKVLKISEKTGRKTYQFLTLLGLGHIHQWRGQLDQAFHYYQSTAELVKLAHLPDYYLAISQTMLASIRLIQNQLEEAWMLIEKAQKIYLSSIENHNLSAFALIVTAQISMANGEIEKAEAALSKSWQFLQEVSHYPDVEADWSLSRVRLWIAQGEVEKAAMWAKNNIDHSLPCSGYCAEQYSLALARAWLAQGRAGSRELFQQALNLLSQRADEAERFGRNGRLIEFLVLKSITLVEVNQTAEALRILNQALSFALPNTYLRPFLDEIRSIKAVLSRLRGENIHLDAFIDQVLMPAPTNTGRNPVTPKLIEPLTEREQDVLRLMAAGLSNPEIAQELYLSLNTIKTHTRGIYGKLGVSNRTQATVRAHELELI